MKRQSQKGLSSVGWLLVILVAGGIITCAFKLVPPYAENIYVQDALKSLHELRQNEGGYMGLSDRAIKSHLSRYFTVNNVRNDAMEELEIEHKNDRILVSMNYEVRVPMFYNLDAVMVFENQFDSSRPDECCSPVNE